MFTANKFDEDEKMKKIITKQEEETHTDLDEVGDTIRELTESVNMDKVKKIAWWINIPKKEQFLPGDVVYNSKIERFGIFIEPSRKEGLIRMRPLKMNSKTEVYTRDWYLEFEDTQLVKRDTTVKRGFIETPTGYQHRIKKAL